MTDVGHIARIDPGRKISVKGHYWKHRNTLAILMMSTNCSGYAELIGRAGDKCRP